MKITYYGHSSFMVKIAGKSILFDPFISPNPLAKDINVVDILPDYMFLSHGHGDHIADAVDIAKRSNCTVAGVYELVEWMAKQGITTTHAMNVGGSYPYDFGRLKLIQAVHSSTLPDGNSGGIACGFVIDSAEGCFYYAGDTALFGDMALIPKRFQLKIAFLPLGDNFTMDVADAIVAAKLLKVKHVIGMHYDTFGYIIINHEEARSAFLAEGIKLELMGIGSSITI